MFAKFLIFGFLLIAIAQIAHAETSATGQQTRCEVSDGQTKISLTPLSPEETYMQQGQYRGFKIETYENEDGLSYTARVTKQNKLVVESDVIMYADSSLKFAADARGNSTISIRCEKPKSN